MRRIILCLSLCQSFPVGAQFDAPAQTRSAPAGGNVLDASNLTLGQRLPAIDNLQVYRPDGLLAPLQELLTGHPTVIVSGCLTCPVFLRSYPETEALAVDYGERVTFYYLYKTLAHPENNGIVVPYTIEERREQATLAAARLATRVPFLVDPLTNEITHALGGAPNSAFLFDEAGRVLHFEPWFDAAQLRGELARRYGEVTPATTAASLNLPRITVTHPGGQLVPRVTVTERLLPLQLTPAPAREPYYAKLRAEVTAGVLQTGAGQLYLGFHLDPLYGAHWNNLAEPVRWTLTAPEGVTVEPATGAGPRLAVDSDDEPREFLVQVTGWQPGATLSVQFDYIGCHDAEGWCKPFRQTYTIANRRDPDAGAVAGRTHRAPGGGQVGGLSRLDRDGDGRLSRDEAPDQLRQRWEQFDTNSDGFLDEAEQQAVLARRQTRQGR